MLKEIYAIIPDEATPQRGPLDRITVSFLLVLTTNDLAWLAGGNKIGFILFGLVFKVFGTLWGVLRSLHSIGSVTFIIACLL
jgi:hypothetical protein